jgi:hypothetical protein
MSPRFGRQQLEWMRAAVIGGCRGTPVPRCGREAAGVQALTQRGVSAIVDSRPNAVNFEASRSARPRVAWCLAQPPHSRQDFSRELALDSDPPHRGFDQAKVLAHRGKVRAKPARAKQQRMGVLVIATLIIGDAKHVHRIEILWIFREHSQVVANGVARAAPLLRGKRTLQCRSPRGMDRQWIGAFGTVALLVSLAAPAGTGGVPRIGRDDLHQPPR